MPFIAAPEQHMMIRPNIVQGFASILPFEIHYRSELDYNMYRGVLAMSQRLNARLTDTKLNIARRRLDMIDMQSFMWVVQRLCSAIIRRGCLSVNRETRESAV
jgi:hypothetical protein